MEKIFGILNTLDALYKKYDYKTLSSYYSGFHYDNYFSGHDEPRPKYSEEDRKLIDHLIDVIDEIASGLFFITEGNPDFNKIDEFNKSPLNKRGYIIKKGDEWLTAAICDKDDLLYAVFG